MPRVVTQPFPREDLRTGVSHTGVPPKSPRQSEHQHGPWDENQHILPKGGLKKHHDHTLQRALETDVWAQTHNAKSHTSIPPQEQSEAHMNLGGERFCHPRGLKYGYPGSGKTISKKHKFLRDDDHRHSKNANTRQLYKWEDEQGLIQDPHVAEAKIHEQEEEEHEAELQDEEEEDLIEEPFRRQLFLDQKNVPIVTPSDSVESRHTTAAERRQVRRARMRGTQQEQTGEHGQTRVGPVKPQLSVSTDEDDSSSEEEVHEKAHVDRQGPEKAMGSGVTGMTTTDAQHGLTGISTVLPSHKQ